MFYIRFRYPARAVFRRLVDRLAYKHSGGIQTWEYHVLNTAGHGNFPIPCRGIRWYGVQICFRGKTRVTVKNDMAQPFGN